MGAKGNQFWRKRSTHGRKPIFETPEDLLEAASEYFDYVDESPLFEMKPFNVNSEVIQEPVAKMRPYTQGGMCVFLDITQETYIQYRKKDGFSEVTSQIDEIIRDQKFSGASAGLFNANIIARDLGLRDTSDVNNTHSGKDDGPIKMAVIAAEMDANQAAEIYQDLMKSDDV